MTPSAAQGLQEQTDTSPGASVTRITANSLVSLLAYGFGLPISLFIGSFSVHEVGLRSFGIWAAMVTILGYGDVLDLGVGMPLVKYVAEYLATGRRGEVNYLLSTALVFYLTVSSLFVLVMLVASPWVLRHLFHAPHPSVALRAMYAGVVIAFAIGLSFSVLEALLDGVQRSDLVAAGRLGAIVLNAGGVIVTLLLGFGVAGLAIAWIATTLAQVIWQWALAKRLFPPLRLNPFLFRRSQLRAILRLSTRVQISTLMIMLNAQVDRTLIAYALGPLQLGYFQLASRAGQAVQGVSFAMMNGVHPAASDIAARRQLDRLRAMYLRVTRYLAILNFGMGAAVGGLAIPLMYAWLGPGYNRAAYTLMIMMAGFAVWLPTQATNDMLISIERPIIRVYADVAFLLIHLPISIALIWRFGYYGTVAGTTFTLVVTRLYLYLRAPREFGTSFAQVLRHSLAAPLLGALLVLAVLIGIQVAGAPNSLPMLVLELAVFAVLYGGYTYRFSLDGLDRQYLYERLNGILRLVSDSGISSALLARGRRCGSPSSGPRPSSFARPRFPFRVPPSSQSWLYALLAILCAAIAVGSTLSPKYTALGFAAAAVGLLVIIFPTLGLVAMIVFFVLSDSPVLQSLSKAGSLADVFAVLAVAGMILHLPRRGPIPALPRSMQLAFLTTAVYVLWMLTTVLWSPADPGWQSDFIRKSFEVPVLFFLLAVALNTPRRVRVGMLAYVLSGLGLALYIIYNYKSQGGATQAFVGTAQYWSGFRGGLPQSFNPNATAVTLALVPGFAVLALGRLRDQVLLFVLTAPIIGFALVILTSREVFIDVVAALAGGAMLSRHLRQRMAILGTLAGSAGAFFGALFAGWLPAYVTVRFQQALYDNGGGRFAIWKLGFHLFEQSPIWGAGAYAIETGVIKHNIDNPFNGISSSHSDYVGSLVDGGLIGLVLLLVMLSVLTWIIVTRSHRQPAVVVNTVFLLVAMTSITALFEKWAWVQLGLLFAYAMVNDREERVAASLESTYPRADGTAPIHALEGVRADPFGGGLSRGAR